MHILPIRTAILKPSDNLAQILFDAAGIRDGDILVISSKAIAIVEGAAVDLSTLTPSKEARMWAKKTKRSPAFMESVLRETKRLNGQVMGHCPGALLTEVQPEGFTRGTIVAPNAGMDESNVTRGWAVGWPLDPVTSVKTLHINLSRNVAVILSDSCCKPRRLGVTAFALTAYGIDPFKSEIGSQDLFGREMRVTVEAVADQLATAGNTVMGNANQCTPAAMIRDHGIPFTDFCGWVEGMNREEDLFGSILR